ncbi:multidrug resistance-associated protein [Verticillium alfalfae VaMs.102]|uniref:Multidrug resistance-associated protein n=1 Tax=Verticillium alfalfae (strain VaMs.102 / ATCC MYA-4576 / FGSC 10136) TaxID=526221 RepID=C9SFU4_VERA1|nr:multidrug resistance-associated protein [Verticillium alfalfae VaMs.102]EEY18039.1 multidrug resistance-associated protein [Verticillium alfalfae VaMs.102]
MPEPADKEVRAPDQLAASIQPNDATEAVGGPAVPSPEHDERIEERKSLSDEDETVKRVKLQRSASHATDVSATTTASRPPPPEKKPWYKTPNPLRWGSIPPVPEERGESREYHAGFFSLLIFHWMGPLMNVGYKRQLEHNDLWHVNPDRTAEKLSLKLQASFEKRVKKGEKYPLLWAMHETFFFEFWLGGMLQVMSTVFQVLSPFTLRFLIQFANDAWDATRNDSPPPPIGHGIGLVLGVTFMQVFQSLGTNHFIYRGMIVGGQARAVLISVIFEKSMSISGRAKAGGLLVADSPGAKAGKGHGDQVKQKAKKQKKTKNATEPAKGPGVSGDGTGWGNGRIVNLMSVDTYRIDQASALFHMIWTAPISILITLALLVVNLSYSALAGFALLVIGIPLLTRAIRSLFRRRKAINKITDQRVSLTQEVLSSVRFVKYFGWETAFLDRLKEIRKREIYSIQILLAIRNAINAVSMSLPIFASMLAFITYSLTNNNMNPAEVFSSLALFNGLRMPLNLLPLVLGQVVDAWSSVKRIQEFLLAEEQEEDVVRKPDGKHALEMHAADFTWERTPTQDADKVADATKGANDTKTMSETEKSGQRPPSAGDSSGGSTLIEEEREPFKLQGMDFQIHRNELVAVIGTVGSGKSSLLAALAGDMRKTSGEVVLGASRAFCPQYAWIQNATVRDNILFGKDMNREWYNEVIDANRRARHHYLCGQKQRLNIARAIYYDSDIVLMDDPLSAVDAHVGRHIFDSAILGLLKDKCRILATHQLWVLNRVDRIIWMEGGKIMAVDTFDNLMKNYESFRQLMETTAVEQTSEATPQTNEPVAASSGKKKKSAALMQQEEKAVSSVPWSVYNAYIRASGSIFNAPLVLFLLALSLGANLMTGLWLSYWTSDKYGMTTGAYIGIYAALGVLQALLMFGFSICLSIFGTASSRVMLRQAVTRALRAPMSFFDTTPLGRITNRFSRDVDVMDNTLTDAMRMYFLTLGMIISVFALIIAFFPWFAIALVPLFFMFIFAAAYYRASAREVKRFESVLRSTVFAKFSEGLSGVASIRAYGLKQHFIEDLRNSIDEMNTAYYLTFSNQRWLSVRLDAIGNLLVLTVGILVVTSRFSVSPSIGGLVLSYILGIVQMIQFTYYGTQLEEEAPLHTIEVRPTWPEKGEIIFDNVEMRYRAQLPLVLSGLSMHVTGGERVGIVGRTGAGKSSIMSTLFRLVELSGGHITIDGIDISTIGLHDLRSRLAIIPQDPTLFPRHRALKPRPLFMSIRIWSCGQLLRQADLVPADARPDEPRTKDSPRVHLDMVVEEGWPQLLPRPAAAYGISTRSCSRRPVLLSVTRLQALSIWRRTTRSTHTIATGFRGRTLLSIAHRLRTIIGYDRICVMDAGRIAELGTPLELWQRDGIFRGMCDRSGIRVEDIKSASAEMGTAHEAGVESLEAGKKEENF